MRLLAWSFLIGFLFPIAVVAQEKPAFAADSPVSNQPSVIYFAQNTPSTSKATKDEEESSSKLPPPPAPRTAITTEKPIKGTTGSIVTKEEPKEQVSGQTQGAENPAEQPNVGTAPGQPPVSTPAGDVTPERTRVASRSTTRKQMPEIVKEEFSLFNVSTDNLRTMKTLTDDNFNLRGMVYGEERGYLRLLEADNDGKFREAWKSPPMNSPVRELFVDDIDKDGETEIVAYTNDGNIFIYGYKSHDLKYRTPENTYTGISCMVLGNIDDDPQLELIFIASQPGQPGNLIQFDPKSQFEEWRSSQEYQASDMIIGNVDKDDEVEIIMNTGEILSSKFKNVKWKSDIVLGDRLYLIDLDNDGILELVTEYDQSYIRIIDVDERREKW
ncbi:MAG: hypothetical protein JXB48_12730 [Candidatus Latescibacteria bacterium]|nr:hypothetical protein [Candidatus Latescibacterota bacterium]